MRRQLYNMKSRKRRLTTILPRCCFRADAWPQRWIATCVWILVVHNVGSISPIETEMKNWTTQAGTVAAVKALAENRNLINRTRRSEADATPTRRQVHSNNVNRLRRQGYAEYGRQPPLIGPPPIASTYAVAPTFQRNYYPQPQSSLQPQSPLQPQSSRQPQSPLPPQSSRQPQSPLPPQSSRQPQSPLPPPVQSPLNYGPSQRPAPPQPGDFSAVQQPQFQRPATLFTQQPAGERIIPGERGSQFIGGPQQQSQRRPSQEDKGNRPQSEDQGPGPAHAYYFPPRMPLPLPTCFHNPTGYACCNPMLNDLMVDTYTKLESNPRFHTCNINAIAQMLQRKAEERFNTTFETLAGFEDFAQKVHFNGDLVCKIEIGGKFMLAYSTVKNVASRFVPPGAEDANDDGGGGGGGEDGNNEMKSAGPHRALIGSSGGRRRTRRAVFGPLPEMRLPLNHISRRYSMWI